MWKLAYPKYIIIIIIIIINWGAQCKAGREWEHSVSPKTPTPHNQPMEGT